MGWGDMVCTRSISDMRRQDHRRKILSSLNSPIPSAPDAGRASLPRQGFCLENGFFFWLFPAKSTPRRRNQPLGRYRGATGESDWPGWNAGKGSSEHGGNHRAGSPKLLRESQLFVEQFIYDGAHLFSVVLDGVAPFVCEANERARHFLHEFLLYIDVSCLGERI